MSDLEFRDSFERERRFLVHDPTIVGGAVSEEIAQAYLFAQDGFAVRVRRMREFAADGTLGVGRAWLTGKGPRADELRREYDIEVAPDWAQDVIDRSPNVVHKRRYQVITDQTWEIDQFLGANEGLWIAELEGGAEIGWVAPPVWLGAEIRNDPRYDNDRLAFKPFSQWSVDETAGVLNS